MLPDSVKSKPPKALYRARNLAPDDTIKTHSQSENRELAPIDRREIGESGIYKEDRGSSLPEKLISPRSRGPPREGS